MRTNNLTLLIARSIPASTLPASSYSTSLCNAYDQVHTDNRVLNHLIKTQNYGSALQLFEQMPTHDTISCNLMITSHARNGYPYQSLHLYKNMVSLQIQETPFTFSSVLSVCKELGFKEVGLQVHCRALHVGCDTDLYVGTSLVDFYVQNGCLNDALKLFDELPVRNLATWNAVLRGLRGSELLGFFLRMGLDGVEGNEVSLSYVIRGCSVGMLLEQGKQLHCYGMKRGWVPANLFVANAIVDFYSNCGSLIDAKTSFECILPEHVISWNSVVYAYANNGLSLEAIDVFRGMQSWGKKPSVRSFLGFLNLASYMQNVELGEQIHGFVLKLGFDQACDHVQSALIDMYGKCDKIESSVSLFNDIHGRTLETCNSYMTALLHCGVVEDVVELFGLMLDKGVGLDEVTFSTTLKALPLSASVSLISCELVHCCMIKFGLESSIVVSCALIDAYSRSGHVKYSREIFEGILDPNLICFTSMISGYARSGMGKEGLNLLSLLIQKGLKPDEVTFLSVLTGCSHSGLVEDGLLVFKSMETVHAVQPDRRHYSCMIDLLGRAGLLQEAEDLLRSPAVAGDSVMWTSLLHSCRIHRNREIGNRAATVLMELKPRDPAAYVQASGFYSEIGDMEASLKVKELKMFMNLKKALGCSLIEICDRG